MEMYWLPQLFKEARDEPETSKVLPDRMQAATPSLIHLTEESSPNDNMICQTPIPCSYHLSVATPIKKLCNSA